MCRKRGDGQVKIEYIQCIAHANIMYIMVCIFIYAQISFTIAKDTLICSSCSTPGIFTPLV